jgi:hypothetical protein
MAHAAVLGAAQAPLRTQRTVGRRTGLVTSRGLALACPQFALLSAIPCVRLFHHGDDAGGPGLDRQREYCDTRLGF